MTVSVLAAAPLQSIDPTEKLHGRSSFATASTRQLWDAAKTAPQSTSATFVVGLKPAGVTRGVEDGVILLSRNQIEAVRRRIEGLSGVTVTWVDPSMPILHANVTSEETLQALRQFPQVDYVEPRNIPVETFSIGCEVKHWDYSRPLDYLPGSSEVIPWNYYNHEINKAWGRTAGAGVTLGVVDTGAYSTQPQLWMGSDTRASPAGRFNYAAARTATHVAFNPTQTVFDSCGHGTRVSSTATAPLDGASIVGVAHEANLVSVRAGDGVVSVLNTEDFRVGIIRASDEGAKVIIMAWGTSWHVQAIKDTIDVLSAMPKDIVFVAASGTIPLGGGIHCTGVYPSIYDNVLSVTGVLEGTSSFHPDACRGSTTDLAIDIAEVPAAGQYSNDIIHFGGTSNAAAVVGGMAALVRAQYPLMTSAQVRSRLKSTATQLSPYNPGSGSGRPNAYKAVGGFISLTTAGQTNLPPSTAYTITTNKAGDGPFQYKWVDGACSVTCANDPQCASTCATLGTSSSLTRNTPAAANQSLTTRVIVTDVVDNTRKVASHTVSSTPACVPLTCDPINNPINPPRGAYCGVYPDGCGGYIDCGACESGQICQNYLCRWL